MGCGFEKGHSMGEIGAWEIP